MRWNEGRTLGLCSCELLHADTGPIGPGTCLLDPQTPSQCRSQEETLSPELLGGAKFPPLCSLSPLLFPACWPNGQSLEMEGWVVRCLLPSLLALPLWAER